MRSTRFLLKNDESKRGCESTFTTSPIELLIFLPVYPITHLLISQVTNQPTINKSPNLPISNLWFHSLIYLKMGVIVLKEINNLSNGCQTGIDIGFFCLSAHFLGSV